jgi:hypothetical protein
VLTFDAASITGVISATTATHRVKSISASNYAEIGRIINTPHPVINNGVLVTLKNGAVWSVTGTSHLSRLTLDSTSTVVSPSGGVTLTVNGTRKALTPGSTYAGAIIITRG